MKTFQQIGKACGGLIKVAEETRSAKNLIEAKIKIRYNYSGFLPATVRIFDSDGNKFSIQVVTHPEGKWLTERNVRLHGTFKRQAAAAFDEFNPDSEQFFFEGTEAISSDFLPTAPTAKVSRERSIKKRLPSTQPNSKANQKKEELITQPIQIVAHEGEASKKGLFLTVDLGDLPTLDSNKSFEDHHSSDNAEVIDITNTEVVPETPEMKMQVNENSNSSSEVNYRKTKHAHKRKYYYRKKEEKEKDSDSEAFKKQLTSWLKENGLKLSAVTDSSGATTSTNALINQLNSGIASKGKGVLGTSIVK
ncbi:hypothetical protein E6C27_scaffold216G00460 [Cucumis melo var. makuwa]|uniref:Uncharacterized protein n=1 Tax=Cucumis melo var. makuwa TaxID=1194695 RepID=A0A5A7TT76_CUCMM|nr:hypothetical protein E6C27_scaffold216G00460 [Cucumis melo var. makuwa]